MLWWVAALVLAAGIPSGPPLDVPLVKQATGMWCWAASTEMVMRYYDKEGLYRLPVISQCDLADVAYGGQCGCPRCGVLSPDPPKKCLTKGADPPLAARGFNCQRRTKEPLTFCELAEEFHGADHKGRPVVFEWKVGITSHIMVAIGADEREGRRVLVNDPGPTTCSGSVAAVYYDAWVEAPVESGLYYSHGTDYFMIAPSGDADGSCPVVNPKVAACPEKGAPQPYLENPDDLDKVTIEVNRFLSTLKPEWREQMGFPVQLDRKIGVSEWLNVFQLRVDSGSSPTATFDSLIFPPAFAKEARDYLLTDGDQSVGILNAYRTAGGWRVASIAKSPGRVDAFDLRRSKAPALGLAREDIALVHVPVFNLDFLYFVHKGDPKLMPLRREEGVDPDLCGGLAKGQAASVSCLFSEILKRALLHNGKPS
jgi:hypothetical protein